MPGEQTNLFETLRQEYYNLTASEKKTADYLMSHRSEAQYLSIAELAEECGVAEATVSRFCRRLGYKGYSAFKLAIAKADSERRPGGAPLSGQVEPEDSFEQMCRKLYADAVGAVSQTLALAREEDIRAAADLLERSDKVLCMGQGGSMVIAAEAAHLFSTVSGKFSPVSDSHLQVLAAANLSAADAVLFFSYSGATREMMETLAVVRERGARVILVTRFPKSPGTALADVVLSCGSNESPLQLGSAAAKIAQIFLLDVLYTEFCRRDPAVCQASRERIAAALAEKHL